MPVLTVRYIAPVNCPATGQPCTKPHGTCRLDEMKETGKTNTYPCEKYQPPTLKTEVN